MVTLAEVCVIQPEVNSDDDDLQLIRYDKIIVRKTHILE